jgi:hypothetical protein
MYNVVKILDLLDIEYYDSSADNVKAICPMHERITGSPDHNPSWFIHVETGQHICFSCGYKGNIQQLVCDVKELYTTIWGGTEPQYDYTAANSWIANAAEVTIDELKKKFASLPQYITPPPRPLPMSESRLALYTSPPEHALASRKLTLEAAERYGVLWNPRTETWILPVRDAETHKLMGWQEKGTVERTFKNRPPGMQKSRTLFGAHLQQDDIAIVVESPLDAVRFESAGISGAVAVFGATVSEAQAKLLRASNKVIAAFDNPNIDSAGKKASDQLRQWSRKYGINLFFFNYSTTGKKDPGDLTDEELQVGVDTAKSSILGEPAYVYGNS